MKTLKAIGLAISALLLFTSLHWPEATVSTTDSKVDIPTSKQAAIAYREIIKKKIPTNS